MSMGSLVVEQRELGYKSRIFAEFKVVFESLSIFLSQSNFQVRSSHISKFVSKV